MSMWSWRSAGEGNTRGPGSSKCRNVGVLGSGGVGNRKSRLGVEERNVLPPCKKVSQQKVEHSLLMFRLTVNIVSLAIMR